MEKRLLLFVVLSSMILLFWNMFLVPKTPQQTMKPATTSTIPLPEVQVEEKEAAPKSLFTYSAGKMEIVFDEDRAAIHEVIFKEYQSFKFPLIMGFAMDNNLIFKKSKSSPNLASFLYLDKEKEISKNFIFSKDKYHITLEINVQNISNANIEVKFPVILGSLDSAGDPNMAHFRDFTVSLPEKLLHPNIHKDQIFNQFNFLGVRDKYFCAIIEPAQENYSGYIKKIDAKNSLIGLTSKEFVVSPGQSIKQSFQIYLGPQQVKLISGIKPAWAGIVHFGTFDFISQLLLQLLDIIFKIGHSWGLAIIILSILIYVALYPLSIKQMRSMKEMQVLQPRIEELRKMYKDNPQKLNVAVMELYKEHKVNPLGGCLPLILQMPIFFALYQALMRSVELKGAHFLWIKDLSEPDKLFHFPFSLPILGGNFNVLPILMMIGMFIQQKLSMTASSGASGDQQKLMLIIMPIMFGVIFYNMPSGLVLYWFVNSALMLVNQIKISKAK
jgi:YidC/Oxa1 family membrane protein insertase